MIKLIQEYTTLFDSELIKGIKTKGKHCLSVQKFLESFIDNHEVQDALFEGVIDPYERKLMHKIADRFNITRTFVDKNTGNVVFQKNEMSRKPEESLTKYFARYMEHKKRLKNDRNKLRIKVNSGNSNQMNEMESSDPHQDEKNIEEFREQKVKEYEKRREELLSGLEKEECLMGLPGEEKKLKNANKKKKKKRKKDKTVMTKDGVVMVRKQLNIHSEDFDPDFVRPTTKY